MGAPYGIDLRKKTLLLVKKGMSKKKVSILLHIGEATVFRWVKRAKEGKELQASRPKEVKGKIDPKVVEEYIKKHPDTTLWEMKKALGFSISGLWYRMKQLGITLKKSHFTTKKLIKRQKKHLEEG